MLHRSFTACHPSKRYFKLPFQSKLPLILSISLRTNRCVRSDRAPVTARSVDSDLLEHTMLSSTIELSDFVNNSQISTKHLQCRFYILVKSHCPGRLLRGALSWSQWVVVKRPVKRLVKRCRAVRCAAQMKAHLNIFCEYCLLSKKFFAIFKRIAVNLKALQFGRTSSGLHLEELH